MDLSDLKRGDFEYIFAEEKLLAWVLVLLASALLIVVVKFALNIITKRLTKFANHTSFVGDNIFASCLAETRVWFISAWIAVPLILLVERSSQAASVGRGILVIVSCFQFIIWGLEGILEWKKLVWTKKVEHNASSAAAFGLVYTFLKGILVIGFVLMALSNLGVNIGALITGLGIGGIAVALAAQNVLGDLFASLSIVLDKPFVVGDYIVSGKEEGEVENIGVKTTRVRSISGEELIFSNKDLLDSRIRNFKRMWQRRVAHTFQINYATPIEKVRNISKWVKDIFPEYKKLRFERCHLVSYGESALNFELVFWVTDTNYMVYVDAQEQLLLEIMTKFQEENVKFGFPMRSIQSEEPVKTLISYNGKDHDEANGKSPSTPYA